jgi:two-component system cell cycle sensor histidine kinase/response regulator CckA
MATNLRATQLTALRCVPVEIIDRNPWADDDPALRFLDELATHVSLAPLHEVLNKVVLFATGFIKSDSCFVYVWEGDELVLRASKTPHPEIVDRLKIKLGEGITGWVAENRKPVAVSSNAWKDPRFKLFNELPEDRFESFLSVPIVTRGHVVGVINLQNQEPHQYSTREITLVSTIGAFVGAEIEMARLEVESAQDVIERQKAEDRFHKAFAANPEPITIATISEERYIDVNESFLRVTGFRRDEVIGRTSLELNFWGQLDDRTRLIAALERQGHVRDLEITFHTRSGEQRTGLNSAEVIEVGGQKCVLAIMKDITERKALEKQLRQAQKMEAIGRLSGGIAHDFNNLLGVIMGYCELLIDQLDDGASRKHSEQILKAAERAAALIRQLLAFSRQQVVETKTLNLNTVLADMARMLPRLIGAHIELCTSLDPALGQVRADQSQIEQIILNLAVNARDAMPNGGKLMMETSNSQVDEEQALMHPPMIPGNYAMLVVTDTGVGMDAQTQAHIFEPFFTTKELGKGTGLGLATVYGSVKQSGGYIWVYSEPGLGTTFRIYLPLVSETVQEIRAGAAVPGILARGTETILLVEDEESLRILTRTILEENGYSVLAAGEGNEALEIARQTTGTIHILLTDMVMPGMNGRQVAEILLPMRPRMKIVYMSGYTGFHDRGFLEAGASLVPKPFTRDALLRKLRDALAGEAPSEDPGLPSERGGAVRL